MIKKLQVFISSTYTDLKDERQAAVKAVLDAGHIPAGMELFKAGNDSQLETIKRWIDDSDTYLLILGGRYGSREPKSGLSYTQVEYEYAINKGIPVFAVILSDAYLHLKAAKEGPFIFESDSGEKYKQFKDFIMSKTIRIVDDVKDIQLAIHTTLAEFLQQYDFVGWVKYEHSFTKNNEGYNKLLEDNLSLVRENQKMKEALQKKNSYSCGCTYEEIVEALHNTKVTVPAAAHSKNIDEELNAFELFSSTYKSYSIGAANYNNMSDYTKFLIYTLGPYYLTYGLVEKVKLTGGFQRLQLSKDGQRFMAQVRKT